MSEINMNGFFDQLKKEREYKEAQRILNKNKEEEDKWWKDYKDNKICYTNK